MNRRDILKGILTLPLLSSVALGQRSKMNHRIIKPKRLKIGDTVALIAPAGIVSPDNLEKAVSNIKALGFVPKLGKHVSKTYQFLAGTDAERLEDIHWAFADKESKAVWCIRGGYGTTRILPTINYSLIKKNSKILIGYSDITALLNAVHQETGIVTFHGPGGSSNYSDYTKQNVLNVLTGSPSPNKIERSDDNAASTDPSYKTFTITPGKCRGKMIGGNLSLIAATTGTRFALKNTKGKILFIEDVNEPPYKVDRLLTQMSQVINMKELAGIALGIFVDSSLRRQTVEQPATLPLVPPPTTLIDVLKDRLGELGIPIIYGLSFGHIRDQCTLPIGINAELNTEDMTISLLENCVS